MKILMSGGGSGGHVTPIKYVAQVLKQLDETNHIYYVGPRGDKFEDLVKNDAAIDEVHNIMAAKWRRYPRAWWRSVIDVKTNLLNLRDFFLFWIGLAQAIFLVGKIRPDVMLSKGGSVSVSVALAARLFRVPIVTHDSDTVPGKSNKIIAGWAVKSAVSQDPSFYSYIPEKMVYTGIPLSLETTEIANEPRDNIRSGLGLDKNIPLVVVLGGSLGAATINNAIVKIAHGMTESGVNFVHFTGQQHFKAVSDQTQGFKNYQAIDFIEPAKYLRYIAAADIAVSRAGATTTAELAAFSKASIIIPASQLEDQRNNGAHLHQYKAAVVLSDENIAAQPELIEHAVFELIQDPKVRAAYGDKLSNLVRQDGSQAVAALVKEVGEGNG